jgi:hypothetical protein
MRLAPSWTVPALILAGGCVNDAEHGGTQVSASPDTLHLLAAFRAEVDAQLDALEQRLDRLDALRPDGASPDARALDVRLGSLAHQITDLEHRLTTMAFRDAGRWRATKGEVDSALDRLRVSIARTEFIARHPP